jgi:hypothetical protein
MPSRQPAGRRRYLRRATDAGSHSTSIHLMARCGAALVTSITNSEAVRRRSEHESVSSKQPKNVPKCLIQRRFLFGN